MRFSYPICLFLFFISITYTPLYAQLSGRVVDAEGEPLAFASVYLKGTSEGTTTNVEGNYELNLTKGDYEIVFQYVGYQQQIQQVTIGDKPTMLNVTLSQQAVDLEEVVVSANAEDPAYRVIRKAIEKRDYYLKQVKAYSCDVYIKGLQKIYEAPKKILGLDVDVMTDGVLDSNRQGIVYLSESLAKLHRQEPDDFKEIMISSKISGDDNGFSFNNARAMDFNFYENTINGLGREVLSPIGNRALSYYRYKLVGTFSDESGNLINKIEVLPKNPALPAFYGHIYIVEDLWNIQSLDLSLTKEAMKIPVVDSLVFKQVHVPVQGPDVWRQFSQTINFKISVMGLKTGGTFTGIFTNYDLAPNFTADFFTNELLKVEAESNQKTLAYWDTVRPIPLTTEEAIDYVVKDSLQIVRKSKPFRDSMDAISNRFKVMNLFAGYTRRKSFQGQSLSIASPLSTIQFNTVQGYYGYLNLTYFKRFDEDGNNWMRIAPSLSYGFGDREWRGKVDFTYSWDYKKYRQIRINGGREAAQFNGNNPISETVNSFYTLVFRRNYAKIYDKYFGEIQYRQEFWNGGLFFFNLEYADRQPLVNQSEFSYFFRENRVFTANDPTDPTNFTPSFDRHQALIFRLRLRLRFGQKYLTYPDRKIITGSKFPELRIHYRKGINSLGSDVDFDHLSVEVRKTVNFGLFGSSQFNVEAGTFLNKNEVMFIDYKHFNGNQTAIVNPSRYRTSFLRLPYYDFSTTNSYLEGHYQHHFEGFFLDRLPLFRKLGFKTVVGAKALLTSGQNYFELHAGLDNIGINIIRLFRVDAVASIQNGDLGWGVVVGIGF